MGMKEYLKAVDIINEYPNLSDFVGRRDTKLIESAERALSLKFPPTYRKFLLELGAGGFGSAEIYGVITKNFRKSCTPDAIWYTLTEREDDSNFPKNIVVISSVGDGELYCLEINNFCGIEEAQVITYQPGYPPNGQRKEIIADDFGVFFLNMISNEVL